LLDDCRDAGLIVTKLDVPAACKTAVIDRRTLATTGAIALRRVDGKWIAEPARSPLANRPWFGRARAPDAAALSRLEVTSARETAHETRVREIDDVPVPDLPETDDAEDDAQ
jgi:hypothetical protein